MFAILSYDVSEKRVNKVMKVCRRYLHHVQNSLFEGNLTEKTLRNLKEELKKIIVPEEDALCIYLTHAEKYMVKDEIGVISANRYVI